MPATFWLLALIIVVSVLLSLAGLVFVRKFVNHQELEIHHDVAGYMLSIIGTLYAVVLGFIVVDSLNTFQKARVTVEQEANSLHDIFRIADGLPKPFSTDIQTTCLEYAQAMITEEWPAMATKGEGSESGYFAAHHLWKLVTDYHPKSIDTSNLQQAMLKELNEVCDNRHTRLLEASPEYDPLIWGVLITGGVVLIVFTYLFGLEKLRVQMLMTGMVTLVLSLNLVIVAMFAYPYSGDVHVSPMAFQADVKNFTSDLAHQD